jgi:hypothetical protein
MSVNDPNYDADQRLRSVRGEIEHLFSLVTMNWGGIANARQMKVAERPVCNYILACFWLTNCLTCATGGNQTSTRFDCPPPSLEEYLLHCERKWHPQ